MLPRLATGKNTMRSVLLVGTALLPALLLSHRGGFDIKTIWYLSVASQIFQAGINLLLLRRELRRKLKFENEQDFIPASATAG